MNGKQRIADPAGVNKLKKTFFTQGLDAVSFGVAK
jgi:hypothetical protein